MLKTHDKTIIYLNYIIFIVNLYLCTNDVPTRYIYNLLFFKIPLLYHVKHKIYVLIIIITMFPVWKTIKKK